MALPLSLWLLLLGAGLVAAADPLMWEELPSMPANLGEVASGVCKGNKGIPHLVVVGQGSLASLADTDLTLVFNVKTRTWQKGAQRPYKGNHHAAVGVGNRFYLIGGFLGDSAGRMQVYDCRKGQWSEGPRPPFASASGATAAIGDKQIIYCGGITDGDKAKGRARPDCARYDVKKNTWHTDVPPMPVGVHHAAAGCDGKRVFFFGGRTSSGNRVTGGVGHTQIYDPKKKARQHGAGGRIIGALCGRIQRTKRRTCTASVPPLPVIAEPHGPRAYDTVRTWSSSTQPLGPAPLSIARGGMGAVPYLNGKLMVFGGEAQCPKDRPSCEEKSEGRTPNGVYNRVDVYDPKKDTWEELLYAMPLPRHGIFPQALGDKVLVCGGNAKAGRQGESNTCSTVHFAGGGKKP
ncbi:hypothetical protein TSOC_006132 [Tetrabaena socialis]|uniref:Uncharacterized protein n=1 Tax=Tetrabaena socialis TaxID=47790 RepID=A0A2J8A4F1_9CHLO|nr:hypothetical protein TSOC_006132 [Tetrabaena socialis]|eukprot:PNH07412.1 hypothetical protein TSOC_006132 [Tetrabaena socialis]